MQFHRYVDYVSELTEAEGSEDGILYADSPGDKAAVENARRERRRRKIIKELFETEKAYLNHLELIHKYFYFPLRFNCILPEEVHGQLFSNVEQIRDVNRTLLELMEQSTVGQAFQHLGPFLKLYAMYANNHEQALTVLQEWTQKSGDFAEFIQTQEARPDVMGLKINALLITPVQRVPRYKMLLEDLLQHTPSDHHDYTQLQEATKQIGDIAQHINEHVRQHENFQKMLSIQKSFDSSAPKILTPGRFFLKEGALKKVSRKGVRSHERMFFLFNDVLLYGKPRLVESGGRSYTCCCVLPIKHCKVERVFVTKDADSSGGGVFKVTCKEESLVLFSEDTGVAAAWSSAIEKAVRKANDDRQTLRKPSSNKIPLRGRSLRKHRQQQKKSAAQGTGTRRKPPRRLKLDPDDNKDDCCSPQMRKKIEPLRERIQSVYDNLPTTCASPPKRSRTPNEVGTPTPFQHWIDLDDVDGGGWEEEGGNRVSVISEGGESLWMNDSSSAAEASQRNSQCLEEEEWENVDCFAEKESVAPSAAEGGGMASSSHHPMRTPVNGSMGSVVSTATGTEIYYPSGSTARLGPKPRSSVTSRIRSYLRRPFTRLQRAKNTVSTSCSPFQQQCSTGKNAPRAKRMTDRE
ncbi:rho guanine nucleotide exchange factor 39-like [Babylonia areolata]|uniref:rho guanine nucleotide exchange factor 39-like n=1 Tax=Babylonia areolata TaxID=304850 RepID=UPI003FD3C358